MTSPPKRTLDEYLQGKWLTSLDPFLYWLNREVENPYCHVTGLTGKNRETKMRDLQEECFELPELYEVFQRQASSGPRSQPCTPEAIQDLSRFIGQYVAGGAAGGGGGQTALCAAAGEYLLPHSQFYQKCMGISQLKSGAKGVELSRDKAERFLLGTPEGRELLCPYIEYGKLRMNQLQSALNDMYTTKYGEYGLPPGHVEEKNQGWKSRVRALPSAYAMQIATQIAGQLSSELPIKTPPSVRHRLLPLATPPSTPLSTPVGKQLALGCTCSLVSQR